MFRQMPGKLLSNPPHCRGGSCQAAPPECVALKGGCPGGASGTLKDETRKSPQGLRSGNTIGKPDVPSRDVRHEQPIRHSFLEVFEHARLSADCQCAERPYNSPRQLLANVALAASRVAS
jgi:hypothetical protein